MNYVFSIEEVMYRYFTKYNNLNRLIPYAFSGSGATELNIYIDLYGLFRTCFSRESHTVVNDPVAFTTGVVNMCAHYREYFKFKGVKTKFFIISSFNVPQYNLAIYPEYNKTMVSKLQNKAIGDIIDLNLSLLELLCPYLPDIFFLKTNFESSVLIYHLITNLEKDKYNMIISTDLYPIQLCSICNNTALLLPRKVFQDDVSEIVPPNTHPEAFDAFWSIVELKWNKSMASDILHTVHPSNLALVGAISKFPDRDLETLINISKGSKLISGTIGYSEMKILPDTLLEFNRGSNLNLDIIKARYSVLDIMSQYIYYLSSVEPKTIHYENLNDVIAVQEINDKYFANSPIDIFRL